MDVDVLLFQIGAAVFAVTGVLAAARQNMDVMSFVIIGVVTAVGGGTLRDLILDQPLFWLEDVSYLYVASLAAAATFFFEKRFRAPLCVFPYLDAVATALFTVLAIEKTLRLGYTAGIAVLMGVITGIGGGIIRDLLTGQPTLIMRRELFMTPILLGGAVYAVLYAGGWLDASVAAWLAILLITALRFGAIRWDWAFPDWLTHRPLK
jgi:uncharacterized membrane protein YeiH